MILVRQSVLQQKKMTHLGQFVLDLGQFRQLRHLLVSQFQLLFDGPHAVLLQLPNNKSSMKPRSDNVACGVWRRLP